MQRGEVGLDIFQVVMLVLQQRQVTVARVTITLLLPIIPYFWCAGNPHHLGPSDG